MAALPWTLPPGTRRLGRSEGSRAGPPVRSAGWLAIERSDRWTHAATVHRRAPERSQTGCSAICAARKPLLPRRARAPG